MPSTARLPSELRQSHTSEIRSAETPLHRAAFLRLPPRFLENGFVSAFALVRFVEKQFSSRQNGHLNRVV
jgi:hypothetical protein